MAKSGTYFFNMYPKWQNRVHIFSICADLPPLGTYINLKFNINIEFATIVYISNLKF